MTHAGVLIAVLLRWISCFITAVVWCHEPGTLISPSMLFQERALGLWHLFSLVCPSEGFTGEVLLPSVGYRVWGSSCHLEVKATVEKLQLYSCSPGHAIFVFLIDAISGFPRVFGFFCFVYFRAIIPLLQQNKPEGAETGKATAVAACYFWVIKGKILAAVKCKKKNVDCMASESCTQCSQLYERPWNHYIQGQICRIRDSVCLNLPLLPKPLASRLCEQ